MRGYPFLRGFSNVQLQVPGMHCTGSIAKKVLSLILECVNTNNNDVGRAAIHMLTLRSSTADMYFRHWREMVAAAIVCPDVVGGSPVDKCWRLLLQMTQLLNAAWRTAEGDKDATVREGAAAIMELTANLMAPLYEVLKPLDPRTADSGVHTLYLHAAVAHLRSRLGANRTAVAHLVDDNVEAHLRASSRYVNARANNAPRAQIFTDMAALSPVTLKSGGKGRSHPSGLLFTTKIDYCPCMTELADNKDAEYDAALSIAREDDLFNISTIEGGHCSIDFPLGDVVLTNGRRAGGKPARVARLTSRSSPKEVLRRGLREQQHTIVMCVCGDLTGEMQSEVATRATEAFHRRKAAAAVKQDKRDAALCRAEQHLAEKVARVTRRRGRSRGRGDRSRGRVDRKKGAPAAEGGGAAGGLMAGVRAGTSVGAEIASEGVDAVAATAAVSAGGGGAAADVTGGATHVVRGPADVFDDDGCVTDEADDGVATRNDLHLLWLSQLGMYMPPDDVSGLVFSLLQGTAPEMGTIPRSVEAKLLDHLAMLQLFRLRLCSKPFALWLVKSKTDAGDVREAADRIIDGLHMALEAISETGDGA